MNKIYVQKRGEVYTVPVDLMSGQHIPVTDISDDLPGFPMTYTSLAELRSAYPAAELVMLEPEAKQNHKPLVVPDEIKQKAAAFLKSHGIKDSSPPPQKVVAVAQESQQVLEQPSLGPKARAQEFLKRLQTALEYSSKKHEKKLLAQVEIIETLIREIF